MPIRRRDAVMNAKLEELIEINKQTNNLLADIQTQMKLITDEFKNQ